MPVEQNPDEGGGPIGARVWEPVLEGLTSWLWRVAMGDVVRAVGA